MPCTRYQRHPHRRTDIEAFRLTVPRVAGEQRTMLILHRSAGRTGVESRDGTVWAARHGAALRVSLAQTLRIFPDSEGVVRVRDLGSRNGTFLNTLPANNTKVQTGDEIRAGTNRFRIEQRSV